MHWFTEETQEKKIRDKAQGQTKIKEEKLERKIKDG